MSIPNNGHACDTKSNTCYVNSGYVHLGPDDTQAGEWVTINSDAKLPFSIRNMKEEMFELVDHDYVYRIVDIKLLRGLKPLVRR